MAEQALNDLIARLGRILDAEPGARASVHGLRGSTPALALARLLELRSRPVLALLPSAGDAEAFAADLRFFLGDGAARGPLERRVHHLPGWEVPPFETVSPTRETLAARAEGLYHLLQTPNPIVVTTVEALGAARTAARRVRATP